MWVKTTNPDVVRVGPPVLNGTIEFGDSDVAQTTKELGEAAIERYDFIIQNQT